MIRELFTGYPTHLANGSGKEQSAYCGLLVLMFFLVAFVRVRDAWFQALCTAMLVFVLLSFAGGFARITYWFPGMNYYRHLAHVYGLVRMLLVVGAGFGAERFWAWTLRSQMLTLAVWAALVVAASAALGAPPVLFRLAAYFAAVLACVCVAKISGRSRLAGLKAGLIVGLLIDLGSFQRVVFSEVPILTAEEKTFLVGNDVRPLAWQAMRSSWPVTVESERAWNLASRPGTLDVIAFSYTFAHYDPCVSQVRSDVMSTGMKQLMDRLPSGDDVHDLLVGCGQPKLRVVRNGAVVNGNRVDFPLVVPRRSEDGPLDPGESNPAPDPVPRVTSFSQNHLSADVDILGSGDAWLIYADGYHPGWTAQVNGRPARVFAAFDAMKAIRLSEGRNAVSLDFSLPLEDFLGDMIAVYSLLFSIGILAVLGLMVAFEPELGTP